MDNRRNFLKNLTIGVTASGLAGLTNKSAAAEVKLTGGLVHHVFFWLKEPGNRDHRKIFENAVADLLKVETIKLSNFGVPASTEKRAVVDNSFTYSYLVIFDNKEGHDIYQSHPLHDEFKSRINEIVEKVIVYDSIDL